jgi:hypothetical protein
MAGSGEILTYRELKRRSNKLAHLWRANALQRLLRNLHGKQLPRRRMLRRR